MKNYERTLVAEIDTPVTVNVPAMVCASRDTIHVQLNKFKSILEKRYKYMCYFSFAGSISVSLLLVLLTTDTFIEILNIPSHVWKLIIWISFFVCLCLAAVFGVICRSMRGACDDIDAVVSAIEGVNSTPADAGVKLIPFKFVNPKPKA